MSEQQDEPQHQTEAPTTQPIVNEQPATGPEPVAGPRAEAHTTPPKRTRSPRKGTAQTKASADLSTAAPLAIPPVTVPGVIGLPSLEDRPPAKLDVPNLENAHPAAPPTTISHEEMLKEKLTGEEIEDKRANRELRDKYAKCAYSLASGCIGFWVIIVSADGIVSTALERPILSDKVLIAITTGVTVNVLAAFLGVIKGLFPTANTRDGKQRRKQSPQKGKRGK